jgi:hypothetical protein
VGCEKPFQIDFQVPANGRPRRAAVQVLDGEGNVLFSDKADLMDAKPREKLANRIAARLNKDPAAVAKTVEEQWNGVLTQRAQAETEAAEQAENEAPPADDCPWREVKPPQGYRITPDGLVLELGDDDPPRTPARCPVWVEALARDYRYDGWGSLVVWLDRDRQMHRSAFPAGLLRAFFVPDPGAGRRRLGRRPRPGAGPAPLPRRL